MQGNDTDWSMWERVVIRDGDMGYIEPYDEVTTENIVCTECGKVLFEAEQ